MTIAPQAVKELREKTNAGMMDCKKALEQAQGSMEKAIEILRKKGLSIVQQKAARQASEGILGSYYQEGRELACLVEVNCETDFVARTDPFQKFVSKTTKLVAQKEPKDIEALRASLNGDVTALITKIGENVQVKQFVRWEISSPKEKLGLYLHAGSKIGVLVWFEDPDAKLSNGAVKEIAMHVAAMNPKYVRREEIPLETLEKEREIQKANADSKKPLEIQNKIIEGKLGKFFSEVCLEEQIFIKDPEGKTTVGAWLKNISPSARVEKFVRLQVGT